MTDQEALGRLASAGDWPAYHRHLGGRERKLKRADLELPPPEHSSRDPWPVTVEVPASVVALRKLAAAHGWVPSATYARGHRWGVGTNMVLVHSVAVRLRHDGSGRAAVALWEAKVTQEEKLSWTTDAAYVWSRTAFPVEVTVTELKKILKEES
jgi:hypothetical protein